MDQMRPDQSSAAETGFGADAGARTRASSGKPGVVVLAAALFLLVAVAAAGAVYVFVLGAADSEMPVVTTPVEQDVSAAAEANPDATEPPPVPLTRVFTFRDVFEPLIKPAPAPVAPVPGTEVTTPTADAPDGTLYLRDVVAVDGEPAAVLMLDGQTYTLKAGESIPGTPWQVVSIDGQTVRMLFGDVPVTLSVGQGVTPATK